MGFVPVPHISARRLKSQDQLEEFLGRLQEVGATEHVFAVGGDPAEPEGPYPDSLSVIRTGLLQKYGVREVSIAGLPRGPPRHHDGCAVAPPRGEVGGAEGAGAGCRHPDPVRVRHRPGDGVDQGCARSRHRHADPHRHARTAGIKRLLGFARRFGIGANAMIVKKYGFSLTNLMGTAVPTAS